MITTTKEGYNIFSKVNTNNEEMKHASDAFALAALEFAGANISDLKDTMSRLLEANDDSELEKLYHQPYVPAYTTIAHAVAKIIHVFTDEEEQIKNSKDFIEATKWEEHKEMFKLIHEISGVDAFSQLGAIWVWQIDSLVGIEDSIHSKIGFSFVSDKSNNTWHLIGYIYPDTVMSPPAEDDETPLNMGTLSRCIGLKEGKLDEELIPLINEFTSQQNRPTTRHAKGFFVPYISEMDNVLAKMLVTQAKRLLMFQQYRFDEIVSDKPITLQ